MKNLKYLALIILFVSCGGFRKINFQNVKKDSTISGIYQNDTIHSENILQILDRKVIKDTLYNENITNYNKFSIIENENNKLEIILYKNDVKKIKREFKFKKVNEVYILKNKNFKIAGVPFLFGRIDIKKLYLYKNLNNDLEIRTFEHRSGAAFLIIFLSGETQQKTAIYKSIDNLAISKSNSN